jgi:ketosteroid isomerase-like protein
LALQDVVNAYCTAVDKLSDIEGLVGLFTADAVFDLSAIHLPRVEGHAGIRGFFEPVFETMTHHAHYWSNFRIDRLQQNEASISAYVVGMGRARDGNSVTVYVQYFLDCVRAAGGWKIRHYRIVPPSPTAQLAGRDPRRALKPFRQQHLGCCFPAPREPDGRCTSAVA